MLKNILQIKNDKHLSNAITNLLKNDFINYIDIGAADGIETRWRKIMKHIQYVGFEPDERSETELNFSNESNSNKKIFRKAVWEYSKLLKINLAKKPQVSSVFLPDMNYLDLFPNPDRFNIERTIELESIKLDDLNLEASDFIKLDIQGSELAVLKGANNVLEKCLGLEVELEFFQIYKEQPLFGEIVNYLKDHNFIFIDFVNIIRWERDAFDGYGQSIFADGLFLITPEYLYSSKKSKVIFSRYLCICLLYLRFDLIDAFINLLSLEERKYFNSFLNDIKPLRVNHFRIRKFNYFFNLILRFFGGKEYKSHILY